MIMYIHNIMYCIAQNDGEETQQNWLFKSGAIHQSFTHPNLYHKTAGRLKIHHDK